MKSIIRRAKKLLSPHNAKKEHNAYITAVSEATGWTYEEAKNKMDTVRDQLGIPYKMYFEKKYYSFTRSRQERASEAWLRKNAKNKKILRRVSKKAGVSKEQILSEIEDLNNDPDTRCDIDCAVYARYGLYKMTRDEAISFINLLADLEDRSKSLRSKLRRVDGGKLTYDDIREQIDDYYELTRQTITTCLKESLLESFKRIITDLKADDKEAFDLITDVEVSKRLLGFSQREYKTFHLYKASFPEKRSYVSDADRRKIPSKFNSAETFDLLSNKYKLFERMPELFGRDMAAIYTEDDFSKFDDFVTKHPTFVCKPFSSSIGRGISLITVEDTSDKEKLREKFDELLAENRTFLLEEQILPESSMSKFNSDSINTIRMIAYYENGILKPVGTFFRTGRKGSFVDNGGAGGIFAAVDSATGMVTTDGTDEEGTVYAEHPDSHVKYKGFQVPEWDQALELVKKASQALADRCYVGWDLALTNEKKWVIVEGNGRSTYLHQGPLFHGVRNEIMELLKK